MNSSKRPACRLISELRIWIGVFIAGLVISGATAIPLETELNWLVAQIGNTRPASDAPGPGGTGLDWWLGYVAAGISETNARHPFVAYGTDWLAFGHCVIALAFVGLWRDPIRNRWLIDFGLIACVLVIPYALVMGGLRGIPIPWRLIDCSFGVFGMVPLWRCRRLVEELETTTR